MTQLIKTSKKKIFLILDNLKVHHSKIVKEWGSDNKNKIELFFLPSYSPDRNPDEFLNCDLKQGLSIKPSPRTQEKLTQNVKDHMTMLKESPYRVKNTLKLIALNTQLKITLNYRRVNNYAVLPQNTH
ncbi:transposase [Halosquirtibacter xylanolyticus]|nr:transposase [Prolixibacteraceae bacterium]